MKLAQLYQRYGKAIAATALAVVTAVVSALSDGHVTAIEGVQIAIAAATAVGVYFVPMHPDWPWAKTAIGVVLSVLNAATTIIATGASMSSGTELILAGLTALLVSLSPASSDPPGPVPPAPPAARLA